MKYLVSIHRPANFDHAAQLGPDVRLAIDAVNDEMVAAGVRIFVGGLRSPSEAVSINRQSDGELVVSDGPFLQASDYVDGFYVDGFWVLECESADEAILWGRKAAQACRGSVEVRPFAGAAVTIP